MNEIEQAWIDAVLARQVLAWKEPFATWLILPRLVGRDRQGQLSCCFVYLADKPAARSAAPESSHLQLHVRTRQVDQAPVATSASVATAATVQAARALAMPAEHRRQIATVLAET